MPKHKSDSIRIFWIEQEKEKSVRIYPKNVPEKKWQNGTELYVFGLTHVCRYFNCLNPDELDVPVRWCYEWLPYTDINKDMFSSWEERCIKVYNTDEYQDWFRLHRETMIVRCTDSMFNDAYIYLNEACKSHDNGEDVDGVTAPADFKGYKEPFWVNYLLTEHVGMQKSYVPTGAWIFRDGSYITVESGNHRRIVEEYMGLKEFDQERWWVKIQLYKIYSHRRMSDAQKKTINKFLKKYPDDLHEVMDLWEAI